jgi:hypothetical protein
MFSVYGQSLKHETKPNQLSLVCSVISGLLEAEENMPTIKTLS